MKLKYLLLISLLTGSGIGYAQIITVGNDGMYIKSGATVVLSRLHLQPTEDIPIQNNNLLVSNIPIPGTPNASIARVYKWSDTIRTKGLIGIYVKPTELNGNTFNLLQLAHNPTNDPDSFVVSNQSVAISANNFVLETIGSTVWKQLTAVESATVLPLSLLSFTGIKTTTSVVLQWEITNEENTESYIVERSADGKSFKPIGRIVATCRGCDQNTTYDFTDSHPLNGNNYYRLQLQDIDRQSSYSNVVKINFVEQQNMVLSPNPTIGICRINGLDKAQSYQLTVLSSEGRKMFSATIQNISSYELNTSTWASGNYFVHLSGANGHLWQQPLIKK